MHLYTYLTICDRSLVSLAVYYDVLHTMDSLVLKNLMSCRTSFLSTGGLRDFKSTIHYCLGSTRLVAQFNECMGAEHRL